MSGGFLLSMLLLGLASGVHCVGMCGGFVTAFSTTRVIPIHAARPPIGRILLFNAGRISTYAILGAASGLLGGELALAFGAQTALYLAANIMLIAIGLHLAGATRFLAPLEALALPLWRRLPKPTIRYPYAAGLAWGFIPCGLVYGALAAAAFAGSAGGGAAAMLAYGLGTAPWLLGSGIALQWIRRPLARALAGAGVLGFGLYGLAHAGGAAEGLRGWICL
jgi:sulfite exporter TauE/SafE